MSLFDSSGDDNEDELQQYVIEIELNPESDGQSDHDTVCSDDDNDE